MTDEQTEPTKSPYPADSDLVMAVGYVHRSGTVIRRINDLIMSVDGKQMTYPEYEKLIEVPR